MMWHEFRELPLKEQDKLMREYEAHIRHELEHLNETFYESSPMYRDMYRLIEQMSLNDFLYSLKYNEIDGIWELKER